MTDRDKLIAQLAASGLTTAQIAARIERSSETVRKRLGIIYKELGVKGRRELPKPNGAP